METLADVKERRTVNTTLNYYSDPGDGSPPTPVIVGAMSVTNERATVSKPVTVTDITGEEDKYTLDSCGFQLFPHESKEKEFLDEAKFKDAYFRETEQLLKDVTGAERVTIFDHKVRRGPANWHSLGDKNAQKRGPLHRVHIDQSDHGAVLSVKWNLKYEADDLLSRRFQIINVWRPIKTIHKDPLAVADATSVSSSDLVPAAIIHPDHRAETFTVKHNLAHRWFYKHAQRPDEVMLIKCFDSDRSAPARRVPHSAFADPTEEHKDGRESIEVRAYVFYG